MSVRELWYEFGDVPMDPETECIEESWRGFPKGTHREEIWHWFEETYDVSVADLMYHKYDEMLSTVDQLHMTRDDLLLEAECVEEYHEWIHLPLMFYTAEEMREAAKLI